MHIPPSTHQGECTLPQIVNQDAHQVTAKCTTILKKVGSSGSIDYVIRGRLSQLVDDTPLEHRETIQLDWGERRILSTPADCIFWKLIHRGPDAKLVEFTRGVADTNRFLHVSSNDSTIIIEAKHPQPPEEVSNFS